MRIAINSLGVNGGGGKTYLDHFLPALLSADGQSEYFVLLRPAALQEMPDLGPRIRYIPVSIPFEMAGRFLREQIWLPRWLKKNQVDLLFSPADATSLAAACPVVLAMRNMNLYVEREEGWDFFHRAKFSILSTLARLSARIAKKIIFVSRSSQKIISEYLGIHPEKQKVIYHGVSPIFFQRSLEIPAELEWIRQKKPYILSVSSFYRYKNFVRLIHAFARLRKEASKDYHLILSGSPFDRLYFREIHQAISENHLESRVCLSGTVPYLFLPALYQNAELFVFPSYRETFGHPLAEAMASEIPVVAADTENNREITGGEAFFFPPDQVNALREVMERGLEDSELRKKLVLGGKEQAKRFSWEECARETFSVFQESC